MVEPKPKAQKAAAKAANKGGPAGKKGKSKVVVGVDGAPTQDDFNKVWQIVDDCHKTTDKHPTQEKCRFCGNTCPTWKKLTVHLARHMESISLPVLDLISDDSIVPPSTKSSNKAIKSGPAPVAPMPKVQPTTPAQLATDMDIDSVGGIAQKKPANGEYEGNVFTQYPGANTSYTTQHMQQTPSRSSPHMTLGQFNMQTPPHIPQYLATGNGIMSPNVGYSPEQNIRTVHNIQPGLHPFEYSGRHELYPSPASATQGRPTSVNGGYSPSPTYSHHQLQNSPSQRMVSGLPGQHMHVQQHPSYFAYGQASGQVQGNMGAGVGQVHSQVVAAAHDLTHDLIENNNGQYPLYAGGTEIPMAMMEVVEMDQTGNQYLGGMRYMQS